MKFMKLVNGNWVMIGHAQLVREVPDEMITMMIFFLAVVRVGCYQYRKYVPSVVRDWAIINSQKEHHEQRNIGYLERSWRRIHRRSR